MTALAAAPDEPDLTQGTGLDVTITRALNALALHLAGATDHQIARQLGFNSPATARSSWERALADTVSSEDRDKARRTELARLDRLQQAWWSKAINPESSEQGTASRMVLSFMERRARMLGLDAPTRIDVYTPTAQEIIAYVETLRAHAGVQDEIEPDVIEIESHVIDDQAS
jgi:hypothetical protein